MSAIDDKHNSLGGNTGFLGQPLGVEQVCPDGVGRFRHYQHGSIYWQPDLGAHEVHGGIRGRWAELGWEAGPLGYPTTDETATPDTRGRFNHFQHGSVYWTPETGAQDVRGAIRDRWAALGWEAGPLSYPITGERTAPDTAGRYNHFDRGSIYWHPATGAHDVRGRIRERWAMLGWERGFLGYPVSGHTEQTVRGAIIARNRFQGGWISWDLTASFTRAARCPTAASPNYTVRIRSVQVRDDDGSRAADISAGEIHLWVDRVNEVFEIAGLRFLYDGTVETLSDTKVNGVTGVKYAEWDYVKTRLNLLAAERDDLLVIFRHGPDAAASGGGFSWDDYDFVVMPGFAVTTVCGRQNIGLMAHEIGHYFGLPHTHGPSSQTELDAVNYFLSHGQNPAVFDGDAAVISDTPPDPYVHSLQCRTDANAVVLAGVAVSLARNNAMSYQFQERAQTFSAQQVERIRTTLVNRVNAGRLRVSERWGANAECQIYAVPYASFRARYDELWHQDWRLHILDTHVIQGQPRYTAVWRQAGGGEIQVYRWKYADFRAKYDELWPQGWRLHRIETEVAGNQILYTAVWRPGGGPEIQVYGWRYADFRAKYDELWPQGWRLYLLDTVNAGGQLLYTGVWRNVGAVGEYQVYGWDYADYRTFYDSLWPQGWRLHLLDTEIVGGRILYTAVWRPGNEGEIQLYGAPYQQYRATYDQLWPLNWRLHNLDTCASGGNARYTAVWRQIDSQSGIC